MAQREGARPCRPDHGCGRLRRILALGDSYTVGEAVAPDAAWPSLVVRHLSAAGVEVAVDIIAQTGWTVTELIAAIAERRPQGPYPALTVGAGVNDQYRGLPLDGFRTDISKLHDIAVTLCGGHPGRVVALSIPDWSVTPFAAGRDRGRIADDIDAFNDVVRDSAATHRIGWVDLTTASRSAGEVDGLTADDGLHPSARLHAVWADLIAPYLAAVLRSRQM